MPRLGTGDQVGFLFVFRIPYRIKNYSPNFIFEPCGVPELMQSI